MTPSIPIDAAKDQRLQILSLGAGVQSTTLLLMSCLGELPKLDLAIFADTRWESAATSEHLEWLTKFAGGHAIPVVQVSAGNLREHTLKGFIRGSADEGKRYASIPLHVAGTNGNGQIRRQCTREYKVEPIERYIKTEMLGLKPRGRWPTEIAVDQWFGISSDELRRVRISDKLWRRHVYPLIGLPDKMLVRSLSRHGCEVWLGEHFPKIIVPRSSCIGCPFHSNAEWRHMKRQRPDEFADACKVDVTIRGAGGERGNSYLHRLCQPLSEIDFANDEDRGQGTFWNDECLGYCGN